MILADYMAFIAALRPTKTVAAAADKA